MEQPTPSNPSVSVGRVAIWTATIVSVAAVMLALYSLRDLLLIFFVAIVVAAALRPLVLFLQRYRVPKPAAVILIYLSFLGIVAASVFLIVPALVDQGMIFIENGPSQYLALQTTLVESSSTLLRTIGRNLPPLENLAQLGPLLTSWVNSNTLLDVANGAVSIITAFVTILAVAFYWTMDQPRMERLVLSLAKPGDRPRYLALWREVEQKLGAYLRGTAVLGVIMAVLTGLGYVVVGLPYALPLALLAGLGEFIPVVGFIIGSLPALIIALTVSPQLALLVLLVNVIAQQFENHVLVPRMMGDAMGVSPVVVIFALLAFGSLFGLVGAFLAIPLAAIIQVLLDFLLLRNDMDTEETIPEAAPLAAARARLHSLRETMRGRLRERNEYLDVNQGLDAVDQRIEAIVQTVDEAIAAAGEHPDAIEPAVIQKIEQALAQVDKLRAEARDASNPVGTTPQTAKLHPETVRDVDRVIREARRVLATAAAEVQGVVQENGTTEAQAEADRLEGEGQTDPRSGEGVMVPR